MGFPVSPTNGQSITINGTTYTYNSANTAWKVSPTTVGTRITYTAANTAPSNPQTGDLWYKINQDIIFEYISDGTTSNWVDISTPILTTQTPTASDGVSSKTAAGYSLVFGG